VNGVKLRRRYVLPGKAERARAGLGSVTIAHTFYGIFNIVSLLTRKSPTQEQEPREPRR
jgi:hypothetical protein